MEQRKELPFGNTIVDIYRTARDLVEIPNIDHNSVQHAVDVARWMRLLPALGYTPYGAARLVWQHKGHYLDMTFLNKKIQIMFCPKGQLENLYTAEQHFGDRILIDMLYAEVVKFATISGLTIPVLEPWDSLDGVKVEDIDISAAEEKERIAYETMINTYRSLQDKEVKESGGAEQEPDNVVVEEE